MSAALTCPRALDIASVVGLRDEWLAVSPYPAQLVVDCSAVEMVSGAGGQFLLAYHKLLDASGSTLVLQGMSERMHEDLCLLGMQSLTQPTKEAR